MRLYEYRYICLSQQARNIFAKSFDIQKGQLIHATHGNAIHIFYICCQNNKMTGRDIQPFTQPNIFFNIASKFARLTLYNHRRFSLGQPDNIQLVHVFISEFKFHIARTGKRIIFPLPLCLLQQYI